VLRAQTSCCFYSRTLRRKYYYGGEAGGVNDGEADGEVDGEAGGVIALQQ